MSEGCAIKVQRKKKVVRKKLSGNKDKVKNKEEPEIKELEEKPEELASPLVLPGDFVGTAEEYVAGSGTYEFVGGIYASVAGRPYYDKEQRYAKVFPEVNAPPKLKEGDIVIGKVSDIKESMVLVDVICLESLSNRMIPNLPQAAIHVSNVKDAYVKDLSMEFRYGDIIKAKIIDVKNLRLSTVDPDLGVLKALCGVCRVPLVLEEEKLKCPKCGRTETRKLSKDYSMGMI